MLIQITLLYHFIHNKYALVVSHLDRMGSVRSTFSLNVMLGSYLGKNTFKYFYFVPPKKSHLPPMGLAAAMTEHLA